MTNTTTATLIAILTPVNTTETVVWTVDDNTKAIVLNGIITALAVGNCVVTATCGTNTATCNVTITNA